MRAFRFRLDRVLKLREAELNTEQAKVEALWAEHARMQRERDALEASLQQEVTAVRSKQFLHPSELVSLERYNGQVQRERKQWDARLAEHMKAIEEQKLRVVEAKMRVRMLEKLREKRQSEWQVEADRELDEVTSDFSAAQWVRLRA